MSSRTALLSLLLLSAALPAQGRERPNFSLSSYLAEARGTLESRSVRRASDGRVENDVSLPPVGPGWRRVSVVSQRGTHYGVAPLVRLLRDAAVATARRHPGAVLDVANLSRRGGGPIAQSHSHQGGRDVDVAFYFMDDKGRPTPAGRLLACDSKGRAGDRRLDVPATWTFVRTLLASDDPVVQWMFCSKGIKHLLLDEARRRKEPAWLLQRAASVLHQPSDSQPHDDHFHIRILCARADRLAGCTDYGPDRAWAPDWDDAVDRRAADLALLVSRGTRRQRLDALDGLAALPAAELPADLLAALLPGDDRVVSERVARTLLEMEGIDAAKTIARAALASKDAWITLDLLSTLSPWRDDETFRTCRKLLASDGVGPRTLAIALETLGRSTARDDLPLMLPFLTHKVAAAREGAAAGLQLLTGLQGPPCRNTSSTGEAGRRCWEEWWRSHRTETYNTWSRSALASRGYEVEHKKKDKRFDELVRAAGGVSEVSYHAQRLLCLTTGEELERVLAPRDASRKWRHRFRHP
ncbi:MAG: penicillin-insensitive murein endopeptidase [Pseudomonadota bacterium]